MDLDGFLKLNDAEIRTADAQATIAGKLVANEVAWQQAVHAALDNLKLFLNIKYTDEDRRHLIRLESQALQRVRELRNEAEKLKLKLGQVTWLFSGGDWANVRDAWLAFEYLRHHAPPAAVLKAGTVQAEPSAYDPLSWLHPTHGVPEMPEHRDPGTLLTWARQHTCHPRWGTLAYTFIASVLQALSDGAKEEAAMLASALDAAQKDAKELEARERELVKTA